MPNITTNHAIAHTYLLAWLLTGLKRGTKNGNEPSEWESKKKMETKGNLNRTPVNNFSAYSPFFFILQFPVRATHSLFIVIPS